MSPDGDAKGKQKNSGFFFIRLSRYSAVSVSQQHIYCQLPTQSRTCKNMQSLFLLSVIIWFADAELKPRKGKSRPRWCVYVSGAKYDAWKLDSTRRCFLFDHNITLVIKRIFGIRLIQNLFTPMWHRRSQRFLTLLILMVCRWTCATFFCLH